jgi:hypothetical protein
LMEYFHTGKKRWLILAGVFSGAAVLVKWLVGLLIYVVWLVIIISFKKYRTQLKEYGYLLLSGAVSLLVFLPWQMYIYIKYRPEALFEYHSMSEHFFKVVEGHGGGYFYHIQMLPEIYGRLLLILFIPAIIIFIKKNFTSEKKMFLVVFFFFIYGFYSLAATKMPAFTMIASFVVFLVIAAFLQRVYDFLKSKLSKKWFFDRIVIAALMIIIGSVNLDIARLISCHSLDTRNSYFAYYREMKFRNTGTFKKVIRELKTKGERYVICNCGYPNEIEIMFYSDFIAYPFIPDREQVRTIKSRNYRVAVFNRNLPAYISQDPDIVVLNDSTINQPR